MYDLLYIRLLRHRNRVRRLAATLPAFLLLSAVSFAQGAGGPGGSGAGEVNTPPGVQATPTGVAVLYLGGDGDGFDRRTAGLTLDGQTLTVLYSGGSGDGFDRRLAATTLSGQSLTALYGGGNGDGFDRFVTAQILSGGGLTMLYGGGPGDGFDENRTSLTLAGQTLTSLYGGGFGDGFDALTVAQTLDGAGLTMLYGGGFGDGFDEDRNTITLAGQSLALLYGGGAGDGADNFRLPGQVFGLPLTLISFEAEAHDKFVLLKWVTEDELDTDFFTIEKTKDGAVFTDVTTMDAAGFSEPGERLHYETKDHDPYEGTSYYRLVTTDFDGSISTSHLVEVQYATAEGWDFTAFPNPNTGRHLNIRADGAEAGEELTLVVFDAAGRQVLSERFVHQPGAAQRFDLRQRLAAGSYLLRVHRPNGQYQAKLLIVGGVRP